MYFSKGLPIPKFLTYKCIYVLFRDDKGEYTCTAGNEYGELAMSFSLEVLHVPTCMFLAFIY